MLQVPGLSSSYDKVGRLVYFGRMLDKNRLHAISKLPAEYQTNLGDAPAEVERWRCCRFLGIKYRELVARTLEGGLTKTSSLGRTCMARGAPTRSAS